MIGCIFDGAAGPQAGASRERERSAEKAHEPFPKRWFEIHAVRPCVAVVSAAQGELSRNDSADFSVLLVPRPPPVTPPGRSHFVCTSDMGGGRRRQGPGISVRAGSVYAKVCTT